MPAERPESTWSRLLTLWGLLGVGMIQPLLDLYGKNPEVFIAARAGAPLIVLFVVVVTLAPALLCGIVLFVTGRFGRRAGDIAYRVLLSLTAFVAASAVMHQIMPGANGALVLAVLVSAGVVWLEATIAWARSWLRILVLVALAAPILFLGFSDAAELVWKPEAEVDTSVSMVADTPVVIIVFDELPLSSLLTREGEVNAALFPNFARLADGSHWFKNGQSNSIATSDSVPILLTGRIAEGALPTSRDHPRSLFTMLGDFYTMDVQETITSVCPNLVCSGERRLTAATDDGVDEPGMSSMLADAAVVWGHLTQSPLVTEQIPAIDGQWGGFVGGGAAGREADTAGLPLAPPGIRLAWVDKMLTAAENLADAAPNTLHYLHVVAPHVPWQANPSGTQYDRPEDVGAFVTGVEGGYWIDAPSRAVQGFQRHLFQLGLVDRLLGRIIDAMDESGIWDDGIVVVTADHGGSFVPNEHRRWVTPTNLDALYRVPLFIRVPGQTEGQVHGGSAYVIDILPTLVDLLDVELGPEWKLEGRSLFDPDLPTGRPHVFDHFTGHREALGGTLTGVDAELVTTYQLIPDQTSWAAVAAVGPYNDLVGEAMAALDPVEAPDVVAEFDQAEQFTDLDPSAGLVPTVLTGRVTIGTDAAAPDVLVAVNGEVAGAGFMIRAGGTTSTFQAVVPEEAYQPGSNEVALVIPGADGRWIAAGEGTVAALVLRDGNGEELAVTPAGTRRLVIDQSVVLGDRLVLSGWSADPSEKVLPSEILVFFGDVLAFSGPPNESRIDVTRWFDSEDLAESGFEIEIPSADLPEGTERVTVVARFGDEAVVEYSTITR
ncbi:MAG TPA: sulfatase-like hydrolase/transferase [Acidimicrobiia bacterium]|nr:sulfatase-like hydrolase/transferase [Acidimicrobiia bacterium]